MTQKTTMFSLTTAARSPASQALEFKIEIVSRLNVQEATMRRVVTPLIEIDQANKLVRIISQGLGLSEEMRSVGARATLLEVAARYRRGEGAIKQIYRYVIFENSLEREGLGNLYAIRLPMGAWSPQDPDLALEWLGRGGFQQGDFVLLPRKRVPLGALEVTRPPERAFWRMAAEGFRRLLHETMGEEQALDEWTRLIGRHDPQSARLFEKDHKVFLLVEQATTVLHPEHAPLALPSGVYEVVEDRATSFWRKAID